MVTYVDVYGRMLMSLGIYWRDVDWRMQTWCGHLSCSDPQRKMTHGRDVRNFARQPFFINLESFNFLIYGCVRHFILTQRNTTLNSDRLVLLSSLSHLWKLYLTGAWSVLPRTDRFCQETTPRHHTRFLIQVFSAVLWRDSVTSTWLYREACEITYVSSWCRQHGILRWRPFEILFGLGSPWEVPCLFGLRLCSPWEFLLLHKLVVTNLRTLETRLLACVFLNSWTVHEISVPVPRQ